jgi:hypothetical protein
MPTKLTDQQKLLRTKTGVAKRCKKDVLFYNKEKAQQEQKIQKMLDDGICEHDIKQQREVLVDTENMIPGSKTRLEDGYADLKEFLETNAGNAEIEECELFEEAQSVYKDVTAFLGYDKEEAEAEEEEY